MLYGHSWASPHGRPAVTTSTRTILRAPSKVADATQPEPRLDALIT
jgi:hypothetical protein